MSKKARREYVEYRFWQREFARIWGLIAFQKKEEIYMKRWEGMCCE